jgi:predicted Zn-dependent peptidase
VAGLHRVVQPVRLRVVPLPHVHQAAVAVMLRGGPRFEGPDEGGRTHALEHLLFRGSGPRATAREVLAAFEVVGEDPDAYTTDDALAVVLEVDPARLERAFELVGDLLTRPRYRDLERERDIIIEERLGSVTESGGFADMDDLAHAVAFAGHPLGRTVLGTDDEVEGFGKADLERLRRRLAVRDNVAVGVAGPVSAARVRRAAARLERRLAAGPAVPLDPLPAPRGPRTAYAHLPGSTQTDVRLCFRGPGPREAGHAALQVLVDLLDGGPSARIPAGLVDTGLCYEAWAELVTWPDASLLELQVTLAHAKVDAAVKRVLALLDDLRRRGPSKAELATVALRRAHRARRAADDPRWHAERAARRLLFDLTDDPDADRAAMDAVRPADVQAIARLVLRPEQLTACMLGAPSKRVRAAARRTLARWCGR